MHCLHGKGGFGMALAMGYHALGSLGGYGQGHSHKYDSACPMCCSHVCSGALADISDRPSLCSAANWGRNEIVVVSAEGNST